MNTCMDRLRATPHAGGVLHLCTPKRYEVMKVYCTSTHFYGIFCKANICIAANKKDSYLPSPTS
jgi:hypothetical protein